MRFLSFNAGKTLVLSALMVSVLSACNSGSGQGSPSGAQAQIDTITPATGTPYGGTEITIQGQGFEASDLVTVGGVNCGPVNFISATELHCVTGLHAAGAVDVVLLKDGQSEAVLAAAFTYGCLSPAPAGVSVWANDGHDKVTRDELRSTCASNSVKNSVWDGSKVSVFGAKNETVAFNLVIEASLQGAQGVSVTFNQLTGPGGAQIASVPVSGDKVFDYTNRNIELFYVRYLQIKGLSRVGYEFYDERQIPKRLERPYTGEGVGSGGWTDRPDHDKFYPDIAVPLELVPSFDIAAAQNQSIWTDIYIPKSAPAGVYTGTLSVLQGANHLADVPVQLTVRGFVLPDSPNSKTMVELGYPDLGTRYLGQNDIESHPDLGPALDLIRDRHFQMAHRHRISLVDQNYGNSIWLQDRPRPSWQSRLDGSLFTAAHGYDGPGIAVGNGIFAVGIYNTWGNTSIWSDKSQQDMWTHTNAWEQWFQANSLNTERFLFLRDESSDFVALQNWSAWMAQNPGIGKGLRSFAALSLLNAVSSVPTLDMVCTFLSVGDSATWETAVSTFRSQHPAGGLYMYNGKRPAAGSFMVDDDGVALRELPWGQFKKGIDRWFYWESTYYNNSQGYQGLAHETNVYHTAETFGSAPQDDSSAGEVSSSGYGYGNGDGVLFYPGTDTLFPSDSYGVAGPIASLRLKYWRRGIEDVDYLTMAQAINPGKTQKIVNQMVPKVLWEPGLTNPNDASSSRVGISWSINPADWEAARAALADIIEGH